MCISAPFCALEAERELFVASGCDVHTILLLRCNGVEGDYFVIGVGCHLRAC